jgi:hypothetical protein
VSIASIAPVSRSLLRLHGWLLMAWIAGVGLITTSVLLHLFHIRSMALRYSLGAAAVYFLGFVVGGWCYARWWNARKKHAAKDLPLHASLEDQREYDEARKDMKKKFSFLDSVPFDVGGDDPLSALLSVVGLVVLVVALLFFAGYLPMLITDLLAGYLAEIVLEFVIGAVIYRRVLRPRPVDGYWAFALRNTWLAGIFMIVVFGALGYGLQQMNPAAQTLLQVFR